MAAHHESSADFFEVASGRSSSVSTEICCELDAFTGIPTGGRSHFSPRRRQAPSSPSTFRPLADHSPCASTSATPPIICPAEDPSCDTSSTGATAVAGPSHTPRSRLGLPSLSATPKALTPRLATIRTTPKVSETEASSGVFSPVTGNSTRGLATAVVAPDLQEPHWKALAADRAKLQNTLDGWFAQLSVVLSAS
eukprot:RCo007618